MKTMRTIFTATAVLACAVTMSAQPQERSAEYEFHKHWYVGVQGGAQYTLGEAKFCDLLSPNVQVSVGRQFSPWLGVRLAANAWQSKGGWNGYQLTPTSAAENITYKYKYIAPGIDVMFNLSNAFCGFNPMRTVSVTAFIGGGANIAWGNDEANTLVAKGYDLDYIWSGTKVRAVGRGGIVVDLRVSDRISIGIEGNANILTDHYNSKKAGNADWYFNALAGVKINLGKTYKKKAEPQPVAEEVTMAEPAVVVEQPVVKETKKVEKIERDVFFTINSSVITETEAIKISELAAHLNSHEKATVSITGYADAQTGNDEINDRLSAERAEAVKALLITEYGISSDRISLSYKGSREQPFEQNDMNRVSICVAE